jgi:tetratricopeptide (TPR) repeat protein
LTIGSLTIEEACSIVNDPIVNGSIPAKLWLRFKPMRWSFLLMCLLLLAGAGNPSTQPASNVDQLINRLGDRNPVIREQATRDLTNLGAAARQSLLEATQSEDPEVAARASSILRAMPWYTASDPPRVREILRKHSTRAPDDRVGTVHELLQLPGNQGFPAVLRLLETETDAELRWAIVSIVRGGWTMQAPADDDAPVNPESQAPLIDPRKRLESCRQLPTDRDDPPVLCLAAAAWAEDDADKALKLYRRAINAADMHATVDGGELEVAFDWVYGQLFSRRQFTAAADLLRRKAERSDQKLIAGVPEPIALLFMLHAKYGPLPGLAADRQRFYRYQLHAPVLYADAVGLTKHGHWIAGEIVDRIALFTTGYYAGQTRLEMGRWLAASGVGRSAVRELDIFLARQGPQDTLEEKLGIVNAQMVMARTQARIANYAGAGRSLEQALTLLNAMPDISITYADAGGPPKHGTEALKHHNADMHGYYLQDALERDDQAEIARQIKQLRELPLENTEIAQEVILWLQNNGEKDAADAYFNPLEKRLLEDLKKDPTPNDRNQLAWFYARCHRRLDEALKLATEAVEGEPTNAAYIDTLAEVNFQRGDADKAVEIERKALLNDPGAPEIEAQMRRFLRGRK